MLKASMEKKHESGKGKTTTGVFNESASGLNNFVHLFCDIDNRFGRLIDIVAFLN
jgi:hypothetical protein